jgi:hypothetical protein
MHRQERPREDCEPKLIKRDGSDVTDCSWCSPANTSCWDKFHDFISRMDCLIHIGSLTKLPRNVSLLSVLLRQV